MNPGQIACAFADMVQLRLLLAQKIPSVKKLIPEVSHCGPMAQGAASNSCSLCTCAAVGM